jgi:hypothetical protein
MMQLNSTTSESDPEVPEYLVGDDGGFIVDPADADDRASLVVHLFQMSDEAQRLAAQRPRARAYDGLDDSDNFARDFGF